ncbi:MAG: hypothetical protein AAB838_00685 [Patescibacteria group bacterium]
MKTRRIVIDLQPADLAERDLGFLYDVGDCFGQEHANRMLTEKQEKRQEVLLKTLATIRGLGFSIGIEGEK